MAYFNSEDQTSTEFKIPSRSNLFSAALSQWLGMGISILFGLIVTPVIIRTLGNESYGLWGLVASFVGFYGLFDFGLSLAVSRFLGNAIGAKDLRQFNQVASTGKCFLGGVSVLVIIFAIVIVGKAQSILGIPAEYSAQFRLLIILSAVSVAISLMMSIYAGALLASEDLVFLNLIRIVINVARSLGALMAVLAGKGVVGLAIVSVVTTGLEQSIIYLRCRIRLPQLKPRFFGFEMPLALKLIGFGAATFVAMIADLLRSKLDVILVTRFGGLNQAGIYAVALVVFRYFFRAISAVFNVTWPRLNKLHGAGNQAELQAFFLKASHITAACASLVAGLLIGLAPLLIRLWLGDGYDESATVARILIGGYFLDFATNPGIGSLFATGRHRYFAAQTIVEAIASFTLAFILGSRFGMNGVALGIVIPIILVKLTIQPWYVARNLSIGLGKYWFRVIGMATLTVVVLAGGLAPVEYSLVWWGWWTAPLIITFALVVAGAILWQMVLDRMDRNHMVSVARRTIKRLVYLRNRIGAIHAP